jgi:heat shock protein HslJ
MRRSSLLSVALVAVVVTGCSSADVGGDSSASASPTPGSGANPLNDTSWDLVSYAQGADAATVRVPVGIAATAAFTDRRVSGNNGCNNYFGDYSVEGDQIRFAGIGSTLIGCTGAPALVEAVFTAVLTSAQTFTVDATSLTIVGEGADGSSASLTFKPATAASLTGTAWVATGISNGKQAVSSPIADTTVTAQFADDGTVSGSSGCNTYSGPYKVQGETITIGPLATTKKLCEADVNEQETAYLAALEAATRFSTRQGALELRDGGGALQVSYSAR